MNKKLMVLLLAAIMLLAVGCRNDADTKETTEPSLHLETETNPVIPDETISGVEILDEPLNNPFDETEDAEQETTENNSSTDNTSNSNSDGNGQSNTGNNDNTGNSGGSNNGGSNTEKPNQSGDETATEPKPTEPKPTEPGATEPEGGINYVSYEEYNNMTPAEQLAYYNQFPSMEAFVQWYNEAKAEYDKEHGAIDVGDGNIDLGDITNP